MSGAFVNCNYLSSVSLPEGVTDISQAFSWTKINSLILPSTVKDMSGAFFKTPITEITLPQGVVNIDGAFENCTQLKEIEVPSGCTEVDKAFKGCTALERAKLPNDGITSLYETFYGCTSLKSVNIPGSAQWLYSTFQNCTSLENIVIPSKVFQISDSFTNCTSLKHILFLGNNVSMYNGDGGLNSCSSLESISFAFNSYRYDSSYGGAVYYSDSGNVIISFYGKLLRDFPGVRFGCFKNSIFHEYCEKNNKPYFFLNGSDIAGYNNSSGYTGNDLSWWLNGDERTLSIHGSGSIPNYSIDGRPWQVNNSAIEIVRLGASITGIGDYSFAGQEKLWLVTADDGNPATGAKLDILASGEGTQSTDMTDANGGMLAYIGDLKLDIIADEGGGTQSTDMTDANGTMAYIGEYAFADCVSLTQARIPGSVTSVGKGAFSGCDSMQVMSVPFVGGGKQSAVMASVSPMSKRAATKSTSHFGYIFGASSASENSSYVPASLNAVVIQSGCTEIAAQAFMNCPSITKLYIPKSVTAIGQYAVGYSIDPATQQTVVNSAVEIVGYPGSAAEEYANANSIRFTAIEKTDCSCICHATGFKAFIYKIVRIFWKIFRIKPTCDCGGVHY